MTDSNRAQVQSGLELVIEGLVPFVRETLGSVIPPSLDWTDVLERKDRANGIHGKVYRPNDLQALLRVVTERLGGLGFPFEAKIGRAGTTYASELREVRNRWAHNDSFTDNDRARMLDTSERLLRLIGAEDLASRAAALRLSAFPSGPHGDVSPEADLNDSDSDNTQQVEGEIRRIEPIPNIEIDAPETLSYASAHNGMDAISAIRMPALFEDHRGAVLRITAQIAGGNVGLPWEHTIDLREGESRNVPSPDFRLDPSAALQIDVKQPATISAELVHDDRVLARGQVATTMLAANGWRLAPLNTALEILAAFVQPNHPAIEVLLREASDVLSERTGRGSLEGYQSGPERVDEIADSIYWAMKKRRIRYAEPPASWADGVQHVRNPGEVLDGGLGTCLDTTLTFAAALEQAGLRTTLWLAAGHIFLGYWREETGTLESVATTDGMDVANYVDLKAMAVLETTRVTSDYAEDDIEVARRLPVQQYLGERLSAIIGVTDVAEARRQNILPLPARVLGEDGSARVFEYRVEPVSAASYTEIEKVAPDSVAVDAPPARVQQWKNALLDLSLRNRLINFTERARLGVAVVGDDAPYLEDILHSGKGLTLLPSDALSDVAIQRGVRRGRDLPEQQRTQLLRDKGEAYVDVTVAAFASRMRGLAYRAKTVEQETGANNLYLALGTLIWKFNDRELTSPLVLVPIKLAPARGDRYRIVLDETGMSTPNYCLLEKLKQAYGLSLPGLAEPTSDGAGIDLDAAFESVRSAVATAGLSFRVEATADIAILQFAKFRLWKDLDEHWSEFAKNDLVSHLIHDPNAPFEDSAAHDGRAAADLDELAAKSPIPADASQLEAIDAAVHGETFVLEGPPGTGKSQTITNLLVRALAEGRKVLFVAEKRAALNVVQKRLEEVGFGPFSLDLHDKGSRPASVRAQIKQALQHRVQADLDGLRTEAASQASARRSLARYSTRLHEKNALGLSYYSSRNRQLAADPYVAPIQVPISLVTDTAGAVDSLRPLFRELPDVADPARPAPLHPWGFVDAPPTPEIDAATIAAAARAFEDSIAAFAGQDAASNIVQILGESAPLETMARVVSAPRYPLDLIDAAKTTAWSKKANAALSGLEQFATADLGDLPITGPEILQLRLGEIHRLAVDADQSRFFGRKKRRLAVLQRVEPWIRAESLPKHKQVSVLTARLADLESSVVALRKLFDEAPGLAAVPEFNPMVSTEVDDLRARHAWLAWLGSSIGGEATSELSRLTRSLYASTPSDPELAERVEAVKRTWEQLDALLPRTSAEVPPLQRWAGGDTPVIAWLATSAGRDVHASPLGPLTRWLDLVAHVESLRDVGLEDARQAILTGRQDPDAALAAFEQGLANTSLGERAVATTLDSFVAGSHDRAVSKFAETSENLRERLITAIPSDLLSARSFDASASSGRVGELRRQLDRQRGGLGVRGLMENFAELILQLTPCVLMSPESVARFFASRNDLFDLVVFDEASQIRVADAIGAMGRARSVVIVGDSKQMPPTSFAESAFGGSETERLDAAVVADEESILSESVAARVTSRSLAWHYRSQDEALIRFSNEHYYGNLSSFPSPLHGRADDGIAGHGICFVRVAGRFLRSATGKDLRTNPVEAQAIVDEVEKRFWASPDAAPSLGIITFNAPQRALIESLLRDTNDERITRALEEDDGLFVKNLENVQGDERDTILFSIAFSANESGTLPLNFGPLTQAGGERRFNVAITRARRQVILFCSFDPADLRSEQTSSIGVKHLHEYLQAAQAGEDRQAVGFKDSSVDRHREEIADELRLRGYVVSTNVGYSDFKIDLSIASIENPDEPLVAVLLDSPAWAARQTVSDRDGLPVTVLRNLMRWKAVERVWMPSWLEDRMPVLDRLMAAVDDAQLNTELEDVQLEEAAPSTPADLQRELDEQVPPSLVELSEDTLEPVRSSAISPAAVSSSAPVFEPWNVRTVGTVAVLDALPRGESKRSVERLITEIVNVEGPIHVVRLAKLVAAAHGLDRVFQGRVMNVIRCVPKEFIVRGDKSFAWPIGLSASDWTAYRSTPVGISRPFAHVHPIEIVNAMADLVSRSAGLHEDELRRETLHVFGISRMTGNMTELLTAALALGISVGRLRRDDTGMIVPAAR